MQDYIREFYGIIQLIPKGKVATYGQIAKLAGLPKHARHVGFALKNMADDTAVPWHRVINSQGKISLSKEDGFGENIQILKLQSEGVVVLNGKVNLKLFQWIL
ncbi:MGMT family protein [Acinetobacter faecalis]|uniref:MGMT family protein n=1 Tax=Acinetobacter faecalis TaxID=2665161 RepID=A0ABU5GKG1_9GAMM|nr:MGMT family protein [Acinetobacter faecalis]MDY6458399.1 MGMT family protein [Acinetobacter faecalis]MDY6462835.1 MGMT family protein [Acinetobacter faecalis]MDY6511750.1 MGMT family protein [Acinetobacter faecalis]MDY6550196.1 MGMT family protein [Acinetobacter faecalis]